MAPKNIDITSRASVQGIASIGGHLRLNDFQNVIDPLAEGSVNINKPASSIPSMFARILFFRTAYQSVAVTPTVTTTVYAKFVSDSLDLLEDLFNRKQGMEIVQWNKQKQLDALNNNSVLQNALSTQLEKFIPMVNDIFLIKENGNIIGGTSPYTIVYTSPNWKNARATQMLITRTPKFREFMYKFAAAFSGVQSLQEIILFINNSKNLDATFQNQKYNGLWSPTSLYQAYPPFTIPNNIPVVIDPQTNLQLTGRNTQQFSSDFFLDSTLQPFNEVTTPLFIDSGVHPGMNYYDGTQGMNIQFVENEQVNGDMIARTLPNCTFQHRYISPIYFLEDTLLKVPYAINTVCWANVIQVGGESCFLPLKPMFFKYFKTADVNDYFSSAVNTIDRKVQITLNVPVRDNSGTRINTITIIKEYSFDNIKAIDEYDNYYTIGVSPFYKSGKHYILRQEAGSVHGSDIEFFKIGSVSPSGAKVHTRNNLPTSRTTYYELNSDFDYIRISWPAGHGILIPIYKGINNGADKYYYGLDFGTTNTHIAFTYTTNRNAQSFNVSEFNQQVEFLSAEGKTGEETGILLTDSAREFLPSNQNGEFSFPIRTVVSNVGQLGVGSTMFNDVSIGFRYSKEYTQMPFYYKDLKWDFNLSIIAPAVQARVRIFCEELLWIVKNHWMLQNNANHDNLPEVWLTYPLAMGNWNNLFKVWVDAYKTIFSTDIDTAMRMIKSVTESLAPCRNTINQGGATTQGILNIDMGGGSTDFQYYCDNNGNVESIYCSVLFAGDDLWGKGYEHTGSNIGNGITENAFTRFADAKLQNAQIVVGSKTVGYADLRYSNPKDKIDCLLKDTQRNFVNALSNPEDNVCRKIMYVHYAAILWHVVKWLKVNKIERLPKSISFTGLASKYLDLLFDTDARFAAFTKKLLSVFSGMQVSHININKVASPKNITAEGAALYALDASLGTMPPASSLSYHLGYDNYDPDIDGELDFKQVSTKKTDVLDSLRKFLEDFNTVGDCDHQLIPQQVIRLTDSDIKGLLSDADVSLTQMCQIMKRPGSVHDSLFFWALKDSLWKIGTH